MISKEEAVQKLKKLGMDAVNDHAMITILLPEKVSFSTALKDVRNQLQKIGYEASFCVKYGKREEEIENAGEEEQKVQIVENESMDDEDFDEDDTAEMIEALDRMDDLLSLDDDGQFTLDGFGLK